MSEINIIDIKRVKLDELFTILFVTTKFYMDVHYNVRKNMATQQYGKCFKCELRYSVYQNVLNLESEYKAFISGKAAQYGASTSCLPYKPHKELPRWLRGCQYMFLATKSILSKAFLSNGSPKTIRKYSIRLRFEDLENRLIRRISSSSRNSLVVELCMVSHYRPKT